MKTRLGHIFCRRRISKPSPESSLIKKEMNDCIRGIVEGLQESYRTVLLLSDFEELSNAEIAVSSAYLQIP